MGEPGSFRKCECRDYGTLSRIEFQSSGDTGPPRHKGRSRKLPTARSITLPRVAAGCLTPERRHDAGKNAKAHNLLCRRYGLGRTSRFAAVTSCGGKESHERETHHPGTFC